MELKGINNQTVELKITRYQFPNIKQEPQDSSWLNIFINVKSDQGNWQTVDPSLMVSEFKELIQWFRDLSNNKDEENKDLYFMEPNLGFELVKIKNGIKYIKIIFSAESKPKSAKEGNEYFVDFEYSNEELNQIADKLDGELNQIYDKNIK